MSVLAAQGAELAAAVTERELQRLLGLPRGEALAGDLRERADCARGWFAAHGRPFAATRRAALRELADDRVRLDDGTELRSAALAEGLRAFRGHAVIALAASAGREVAGEVARLWAAARPDEAFFLDRFAAAVAEALVRWAAGVECRAASPFGETLLPPLAPGCGRFELGDQHHLMRLLEARPVDEERVRLGPIDLLATGALDPPHSVLVAFGVTRQTLAAATPEDLCRACELEPCAFRRAPFTHKRAAAVGAR